MLDLRSVGWVITRDALAEVLRVKLGGRRSVDGRVLRTVAVQWRALQTSLAESGLPLAGARFSLNEQPLSTQTNDRLFTILRDLGTLWPRLYAVPALRRRGALTAMQSAFGLASGIVLSGTASAESTTLASVAFVMLVMGLWSLATATQLWRTWRIARDAEEPAPGRGVDQAPTASVPSCEPLGGDPPSGHCRDGQPAKGIEHEHYN